MTGYLADGPDRFAFDAIGTRWAIETPQPIMEPLRQIILARAEAFDATWSRFREDSLVSEIARADRGGRFRFPVEAHRLFDLYDELHAATAGAVDPWDKAVKITKWVAENLRLVRLDR